MKVLVIGGSGFIGSFLLKELEKEDHEIFRLEEYFFKTLGELKTHQNHLQLGNISDALSMKRVFRNVQPDIVIHLAAMTAVAYSYDRPLETTRTNYIGTVTIAETLRDECPDLKQFIYPSSAEVYGVNKIPLKREIDPLLPNSPYAVSKRATEDYLNYMRLAFDFPVTIFRPFNTYGRTDSHWFIVEKLIYQMLTSDVVEVGDPDPIRDFLYVPNHIEAYLKAIDNKTAIGETFNLSTGRGVTIRELAEIIAKLTRFKGEIKWGTMPKRDLDIIHLVGDNTKIKSILKISTPISLEEGLKLTVQKWRKIVKRRR